jgi:hypothetical protein
MPAHIESIVVSLDARYRPVPIVRERLVKSRRMKQVARVLEVNSLVGSRARHSEHEGALVVDVTEQLELILEPKSEPEPFVCSPAENMSVGVVKYPVLVNKRRDSRSCSDPPRTHEKALVKVRRSTNQERAIFF